MTVDFGDKTANRTGNRRRAAVEPLEGRALLAYTFSLAGSTATATGDATDQTLEVVAIGGLLEHSEDGGATFSDDWDSGSSGSQTLPASVSSTVDVVFGSGTEGLALGDVTHAASELLALIHLDAPATLKNNSLTIDDSASAGGGTYTVDTGTTKTITGPGINYSEAGSNNLRGGVKLLGSRSFDNFHVLSTPANSNVGAFETTTIVDNGGSRIDVGNNGSVQAIAGPLTVSGSTPDSTALFVDDSADPVGRIASLGVNNTSNIGTVSGLAPAEIDFAPNDLIGFGINGGSGGNTFTIFNTIAGVRTALNTGSGQDSTSVLQTTGPLDIDGQSGLDVVTVGLSRVAFIQGDVSVRGALNSMTLIVNNSQGRPGGPFTLAGGSLAEVNGLAPATISYMVEDTRAVSLDTGQGNVTLIVDFSTGNPLPQGGGLSFNGGTAVSNTLDLRGTPLSGPFASEVNEAEVPGGGAITFVSGSQTSTSLFYSSLTPINDTVGATQYTFDDASTTGTAFSVTDGPTVLGLQTASITSLANPTAFETTNIGNKGFVTVATHHPGTSYDATIDLPTAPSGMTTLAVDTTLGGDDVIGVAATPPGVVTSVSTGPGDDLVGVTASGVAAGATLHLDGGAGFDRLIYDAAGKCPTVTAGATPGELIITDNSRVVDAVRFESLSIGGSTPAPPVLNAVPLTVGAVRGTRLVDVVVATLTGGSDASDFASTIQWGDGTTEAGVIVQDASNPSVFDVRGSHTYTSAGAFAISTTVVSHGSVNTTVINGVSVTTTTAASGPVTSTTANATVGDSAILAQGATISGVEGQPVTAFVASFTDASATSVASDFTAAINWGDGSVTAGRVSALGSSAGVTFMVTGTHDYQRAGLYPIAVAVTDMPGGAVGVAHGQAVVAVATIVPVMPQPTVATGAGLGFSGFVAGFTDLAPIAAASRFVATIDWGDGTPQSAGQVVELSPGAFGVIGTHTYALGSAGTFPVTTAIANYNGSLAKATTTAVVADSPIVVTGGLAPSSDTGASNTDHITMIDQPTFVGTSKPGAIVTLTAVPLTGGAPTTIGLGFANAAGVWSITSGLLVDGRYAITASAVLRNTTSSVVIVPASAPLVIDTAGPQVVGVSLDRLHGRLDVTMKDNLSGLDPLEVFNSANFFFGVQGTRASAYRVTGITLLPSSDPLTETVVLTINGGRPLRGGAYTAKILSGSGVAGVRDEAGNALDGEFYGTFPSGDGRPGGDFVAVIDTIHNTIYPPKGVIGTVSPLGAGRTSAIVHIPTVNPKHPLAAQRLLATTAARNAALQQARLAAHDAALAQAAIKTRRRY